MSYPSFNDPGELMHAAIQRDAAFAETLKQLFIANPLWDGAHEMHHAVRGSALRKARSGGYCDYAPGGMIRWRNQLRENASDWNVPEDELVAIHALIYG